MKKKVLGKYTDIHKKEIIEIPTYFDGVALDEWIIMPNHIHLIIVLVDTIHPKSNDDEQYRKNRRQMTISKIIGKFKMKTSKQMNAVRNTQGHKNWQPDYYDRIIRNEQAYQQIKQYIINNPKNWDNDIF